MSLAEEKRLLLKRSFLFLMINTEWINLICTRLQFNSATAQRPNPQKSRTGLQEAEPFPFWRERCRGSKGLANCPGTVIIKSPRRRLHFLINSCLVIFSDWYFSALKETRIYVHTRLKQKP